MAIYLNNNVGVKLATAAAPTIPSINISAYVSAVTLTQTVDEIEVTAMGDSAHKYAAGLQAATLTIDFFNDWAATQVMTTLNAAFGTTLAVSMITGAGSSPATVSATMLVQAYQTTALASTAATDSQNFARVTGFMLGGM